MSTALVSRTRRLRPASLRGRVVLAVLALLLVLLVALLVAVDLALGARLRSDLRTRLTDRVALAQQLDGALSAQQLVDRLTGDGVQVQLCSRTSGSASSNGSSSSDGSSSSGASQVRCVSPVVAPGGARPIAPGAAGPGRGGSGPAGGGHGASKPSAAPTATSATFTRDGSTLFARATLPNSGQVLSLSVDEAEVGATIRGLVVAEIIGALLALVLAAVVLGRVVGVALRPLDDMTTLARRIAAGDRGRRLDSAAPDSELGRTAEAFDAMLDELESALTDADDARQRLRRFLGDATHELRSPLAGVRARAEQLLRREPDRATREQAYVSMIREANRANRLVDDLLTVARFEQATVDLQLAPVDLHAVATEEAERIRLRGPNPSVVVTGEVGVMVVVDRQRLTQVVGNLVDNAVRAAHDRVELRVTTAVTGTCAVDVVDDGPGVPAQDRERIFERLVRLDESRARDTGGFGLGLPIARGLARAHGGDVTYVPTDRGACFRLTIPILRTESTALNL